MDNMHDEESPLFHVMRVIVRDGAPVTVMCCPAGTVGARAGCAMPDSDSIEWKTLPDAGVMLNCDQSWITNPRDLIGLAEYLSDCALWLAEQNEDSEFIDYYFSSEDDEDDESSEW